MEGATGLTSGEERALARCRRALERGRCLRGRVVAEGEHGLLLDLRGALGRGALGHVPPEDARERPPVGGLLGRGAGRWEGWVVAVAHDLVHLSARRPGDRGQDGAVRRGEILNTGRAGAIVRIEGEAARAVVPWEELSWEPLLERPRLQPGVPIEGRVVGLTLDGPVLSPRSLVPSPWPAIALALPAGTRVRVRVEDRDEGRALLRADEAPRAAAVADAAALPPGAGPGSLLEAEVLEVDAVSGRLALTGLSPASPGPRGPRPGPAAPRRGRPGPEQAASGSRS